MDKLSKVLFVLWIVLAIAAFIGAFWATPTIVRTLSIIFGIINMGCPCKAKKKAPQPQKTEEPKDKENK